MPIYSFLNASTGEKKDVLMSVNDKHEYIDEKGVKWQRVWHKPFAATDTRIENPYSKEEFLSKTQNKKDKVGEWWDRSKELSIKRADKDGIDPIKEKYYQKYSEKRGGKAHPDVRKRKIKDKLDKMGVILE